MQWNSTCNILSKSTYISSFLLLAIILHFIKYLPPVPYKVHIYFKICFGKPLWLCYQLMPFCYIRSYHSHSSSLICNCIFSRVNAYFTCSKWVATNDEIAWSILSAVLINVTLSCYTAAWLNHNIAEQELLFYKFVKLVLQWEVFV